MHKTAHETPCNLHETSLWETLARCGLFRCTQPGCGGLLRPHVMWFGEGLDPEVMARSEAELYKCDLCLVVS